MVLTLFLILDAVRKGNDAETSGESEVEKRVKEVLVADVAKFRCWLREECDGEVLFLVYFYFLGAGCARNVTRYCLYY